MAKKEKKQKEPKRKPKYGVFSCVKYIYQLLWKYDRGLAFTGILTVPVSLILSAIGLYTPSVILSVLDTADKFSFIALVIVGLLLAKLLFELSNSILNKKIRNSELYILYRMLYMWNCRKRDRDWYLDFEPEIQKMNERADKAIQNNYTAGVHFPMDFSNMLSQILNFLLFGSVISLLHPVIIILLAIGCVLNYFMSKWVRKKNWNDRDIRNDLDKKIDYSTFGMSRDFKYAKDVRLYTMQKPSHERLENLFALRLNEQKKMEWRGILNAIENFLVVLIRDGAAYAFLIFKAVQGEVDASSFVLYFSAITSMSGLMGSILGTINRVQDGAMQISDFREAMELPDRLNRDEGIPTPKGPFTIEFRNVSFKYPQGEKKILDNVSFRIESGEKIALVGLNGAGKTTLTMLMCGLLMPDEGQVLLDGHPLTDYNRDALIGVNIDKLHLV